MITFSKLGNYGRLGNQLFQFAMLISLREKLGFEIKLPEIENRIWHGQKNLLNNFNLNYEIIKSTDKIEHSFVENGEFDESVFDIQDNTDIHGYFGNYKYFSEYKEIVKRELMPKKELLTYCKQKIESIKKENSVSTLISLHVRRGDTDLSIYEKKDSEWFNYLKMSKSQFDNDVKFLVFTGGQRSEDNQSDYDWCKKNLDSDEYIFINEESSTILDFCYMLSCDGHILSPTSTLSWWIGFLSDDNKKVVAPKKYKFLKHESPDGFYPEKFVIV